MCFCFLITVYWCNIFLCCLITAPTAVIIWIQRHMDAVVYARWRYITAIKNKLQYVKQQQCTAQSVWKLIKLSHLIITQIKWRSLWCKWFAQIAQMEPCSPLLNAHPPQNLTISLDLKKRSLFVIAQHPLLH